MTDSDAETLVTEPGPDPFPSFNHKRRRGVKVTTAAAVALGLALGGGAIAGATTSSPPSGAASHPGTGHPTAGGSPPAAMGTVKSVGAGTFTLTTEDGTSVAVDVSSTTTYRDPGVTSPTMADVKVGEHVAVFGTDTSNTVTATSVAIGTPPAGGFGGAGAPGGLGGPGGRPAAMGTVKSVGSGTFTLTTEDGTSVAVDVSSTTTYRDPGVTSPTMADVKVGEHVAVFGTDTSNTVTATSVAIGTPPAGGPGGPGGSGGPGKGSGKQGGPPSGTEGS